MGIECNDQLILHNFGKKNRMVSIFHLISIHDHCMKCMLKGSYRMFCMKNHIWCKYHYFLS